MIAVVILTGLLATLAFADTSAHEESTEYVADQATLDALYQKHLSLRGNTVKLTEKQADLLRAMGIEDDKIAVITNGEVADLLKTGEIVKPVYIINYVDEETLILDAIETKDRVEQIFMKRGLNKQQIQVAMENGIVPWLYEDDDNSKLLQDLKRLSSSITPMSSSCHVFTGTRAYNLLTENNVHFQSSSYPTSTSYQGQNVSLPLQPVEGTLAYTLKCDMLASHLYDTSDMTQTLYNRSNSSGTSYNYFLWGEETSSTSNSFHQGVDVNRGYNTPLYSISDGIVVQRVLGSTDVLSKYQVYNANLNVTVQYLHGNWSSASTSSVLQGDLIGTEDTRGPGGYHTHIQIMNGYTTTIPDYGSTLKTLKPYYYFWYWC